MAARRYYFPKFDKPHPMFYVARTSRQMIASNEHIVDVFKKYAKESYPESPRQILYLMTRHNESVFDAIESGSTSPKVKSSPESSSPRKRKAKVSTLKRKKLPFVALGMSENKESKSSVKITKKDNVQELTSPNANIKMSENPDTTEVIQNIEFKRPATPIKDTTDESSLAKRQKLTDTADIDAPSKQTENLENEGSITTMETDNVQESTSPSASIKMSDNLDTHENQDTMEVIESIEFKRSASPTKDGTEDSNLVKRPKLSDTADIDVPSKQTESPKTEGSIETEGKVDVQVFTIPSASIKMSEEPDITEIIQNIELKRPATPIKDGTVESSLAERPKLTDTADVDIPSKQTENLETEGSIETMEKDVQESTSSKMSDNPDTAEIIQNIELKSPATPIKDGTEESSLAKRPKLTDTADVDMPSKRAEGSTETMEKDDVQELTSTSASIKTSENLNTSEDIKTAEFKRPASPIKDGTEEPSLAKRPKLIDNADVDVPIKQTENLETEGCIETMEKDIVQESTSPSASENLNTSEAIKTAEFERPASPIKDITEESGLAKRPASPIQDGTEESRHAKRPKLTDIADIDIPSKQTENLETEGSIKTMGKDAQLLTSPSASIKMSENQATMEVIESIEFKRHASPIKDGTEDSNLVKRHKISDTADIDVPSKQTESPKTEGSIETVGKDDVQVSTIPRASIKMSEEPDITEIIQNIEFKRPATPIKDLTEKSSFSKRPKLADTANIDVSSKQTETFVLTAEDNKMDTSPTISDKKDLSPDQNKLPENIRLLIKSIPILEKDEIEFNMSGQSNENLEETEIYHLVDDPSQVESVRKAVEVRLKDDVFLKKSKDCSPLKGNTSNRSPRKSRRTHSPGKDTEKILGSDDPDIISTHPSVLEYLKVRFSLVKKYRHKYMHQILESLKAFQGDLLFLYYYAKTASLMVENTPVEDKEYFTENLKNLIDGFVKNVKKLTDKLRVSLTALKSDILFWSSGLKKIRKLAAKNEPLISKKNDPEESVPLLRKYESDLRKIWEQMDSRILLRNGLRSALLEMAADYAKVAEDYIKYLVMVEILKPSLVPTVEGVQEK